MTANAINYFRNLEAERANRASEALRQTEIEELRRHNQAYEAETVRHNLAGEAISSRTNDISETQTREQQRHNRAMEELSQQSNAITAQRVAYDYDIAQRQLGETTRHNEAQESETKRHNVITEGETFQHNRKTEFLSGTGLEYDYTLGTQRNVETERHNKASERIEMQKMYYNTLGDLLSFGSVLGSHGTIPVVNPGLVLR